MPNGSRRLSTLYKKALKLKPAWTEGLWEAGSIEYDQDQYKECSADFRATGRLEAGPVSRPGPWRGFANTICGITMRR